MKRKIYILFFGLAVVSLLVWKYWPSPKVKSRAPVAVCGRPDKEYY